MTDTSKKVLDLTAAMLDLEATELSSSTNFVDDLHLDSLQMMELILAFEDEFSIDIDNEQAEEIKTIGDVVRFIDGATSRAAAQSS